MMILSCLLCLLFIPATDDFKLALAYFDKNPARQAKAIPKLERRDSQRVALVSKHSVVCRCWTSLQSLSMLSTVLLPELVEAPSMMLMCRYCCRRRMRWWDAISSTVSAIASRGRRRRACANRWRQSMRLHHTPNRAVLQHLSQ